MIQTTKDYFMLVKPKVEVYIRRRFYSYGDETEDILSEAFIGVWRGLQSFDPKHPKANVIAWSLRSAKDAAITYLKGKKVIPFSAKKRCEHYMNVYRIIQASGIPFHHSQLNLNYKEWVNLVTINNFSTTSLDTPLNEEDDTSLSDTIPALEKNYKDLELLKKALTLIPPEHQLLIILYDVYGMTYAEISQIDGRTEMAILNARNSALLNMKFAIKDIMKEEGVETKDMEELFKRICQDH